MADALRAGRLEEAVRGSAALFISSNTLVGAEEAAVTMRARELALSLDRPVVFDPQLRLDRWRSRAEAAATANACVPGALLVRATAGEAALMTGEDDPERAALALLKAGARMVVITLGPSRARSCEASCASTSTACPATVLSTIGAGDCLHRHPAGPAGDVGVLPGGGGGVAARGDGAGGAGVRAVGRP